MPGLANRHRCLLNDLLFGPFRRLLLGCTETDLCKDILIDFFGLEDEQIEENFEDEHTYDWNGVLYMVKRVQSITREELDIVKRFC